MSKINSNEFEGQTSKKTYVVVYNFAKFVEVEVEAESEEEALELAELPKLDWFDKRDTSLSDEKPEVYEL